MKTKRNKKRVNCWLPASLYKRAVEVAEFEEISLTDVIISALKNYIDKEELKKPVEFE